MRLTKDKKKEIAERQLAKIDFEDLKKQISETSMNTSIYVGCDSQIIKQTKTKGFTRFITCVVIHYETKHGGKAFFQDVREYRVIPLKERLLKEVYSAVGVALEIVDAVGDRNFECHIDIASDPRWGSNIVHKEAVSYVRANGLNVKSKPYSFTASAICDYLLKKV
jgi:predicted RNase H-related nuclease YkuK (DUF458 family)